jgi:Glyoxalase/Bleomycin resistance protein/Dioxygenase superfamily
MSTASRLGCLSGPAEDCHSRSQHSAAQLARPSASAVGQDKLQALQRQLALHHVSYTCADVQATRDFYVTLLGFIDVKRPDAFKFEGRWCGYSLPCARTCVSRLLRPRREVQVKDAGYVWAFDARVLVASTSCT